MRRLLRPAVRGSLVRLRHIRAVPPSAAPPEVAAVYQEVEDEFGLLAPPVALHAPAPLLLTATWTMLRETLVATGSVPRECKEAVASAVSEANRCPYCVQIHGLTLHGLLSRRAASATSVAVTTVGEPELWEVAAWLGGPPNDGSTTSSVLPASAAPPTPPPALSPLQAAELVGVAVTFHYLNRVVNVFLAEPPVPAQGPAAVRRNAQRLLGRVLGGGARAHREPGRSLDLLPSTALPEDLSWTRAAPTVAGAFARAADAVTEAGRRAVPDPVRDMLHRVLSNWDGAAPGLDLAHQVEDYVAGLPAKDRPAGRLVLLTALASYRVAESTVAPLRAAGATDADLLALVAWPALTTARRAGTLAYPRIASVPTPRAGEG
ncbi:carboxymuconolactone decarboxylase family protein [Streptomyces sp. NRRL B-1677]|nr:carboxymuconolactone decarboxylase family protein [Streptomyces sp. NRRL B-1677]